MHCNYAMQVDAVSSANSATGYPARFALHRISNVNTVHRNHASPRSMSRQSAFLGQPAVLQPEGWNASIRPQSPQRCQDPLSSHPGRSTTAGSSGTAVAALPGVTPRHAAVVCKAIGISKPKVPSLSLAALQADRHHLNVQASHRKVYWLTQDSHLLPHCFAPSQQKLTSSCVDVISRDCALDFVHTAWMLTCKRGNHVSQHGSSHASSSYAYNCCEVCN